MLLTRAVRQAGQPFSVDPFSSGGVKSGRSLSMVAEWGRYLPYLRFKITPSISRYPLVKTDVSMTSFHVVVVPSALKPSPQLINNCCGSPSLRHVDSEVQLRVASGHIVDRQCPFKGAFCVLGGSQQFARLLLMFTSSGH